MLQPKALDQKLCRLDSGFPTTAVFCQHLQEATCLKKVILFQMIVQIINVIAPAHNEINHVNQIALKVIPKLPVLISLCVSWLWVSIFIIDVIAGLRVLR